MYSDAASSIIHYLSLNIHFLTSDGSLGLLILKILDNY
jgi:hypothetical protein